MIYKVTRYRTWFIDAETEEQARVLCNVQRFSMEGFADFPGRPFEYEERTTIEPHASNPDCVDSTKGECR